MTEYNMSTDVATTEDLTQNVKLRLAQSIQRLEQALQVFEKRHQEQKRILLLQLDHYIQQLGVIIEEREGD